MLTSRSNALWAHLDIAISWLKSKPQLFPRDSTQQLFPRIKKPFTAVLGTEREAVSLL